MIYFLYQQSEQWLAEHGLGFFRVFDYISFRAVCAMIFSFLMVLVLGGPTIRWLLRMKIGDRPEFYHQDLNQLMKGKTNTPTMGGILISGSILLATLLLGDLTSFYVCMAMLCVVWLSIVGIVDDWLKLTTARRQPGTREGLYTWEKLLFQLGLAVVLGFFIHGHGVANDEALFDKSLLKMAYSVTLPFLKSWQFNPGLQQYEPSSALIVLGPSAFVILTVLVIVGSSNAVNLTDGMDGLASGIMGIVAFAFMVLAFIAGDGDGTLAKTLLVPYIPTANELVIVAAAMVGSCLGFLWYNCSPAQVFMGDTGALPLGGLIGYIAVVIRQEFLLLIIGGIFVLEVVSVIMQVGYFRMTGGKRILKCAPVHHHFHLCGWTEQQVVVRFWLLSAVFAAIALATIKLR